MNNFFNQDNPLFRLLSRFFDIMLLNFLFILTSIPLFTIGASLSSAYSICIKLIKNEYPSIIKEYFNSFKENFKQSTLVWLIFLAGIGFFGADLYIIYWVIDKKYVFTQVPVWIFISIFLSIYIYAFPQIARFTNTTKNIIKNSILISLSNIPNTIFIIVLHLFVYYITFVTYNNLIIGFSLFLFCGFGMIIYFITIFTSRIFDKINPDEENV